MQFSTSPHYVLEPRDLAVAPSPGALGTGVVGEEDDVTVSGNGATADIS